MERVFCPSRPGGGSSTILPDFFNLVLEREGTMSSNNSGNSKGNFTSNFGFLMASIGSAIGLGNIWGFPYKMGANGGFAFLLIYILLAIFVGFPLTMGEIALGRKTQKAAVEAFGDCHPKFRIVGVFETIVPFLLICFYTVLSGIVIQYMIANLGDLFGASWGTAGMKSDEYFGAVLGNVPKTLVFTIIFLLLTSYVVYRGIQNGIEKFCNIGMPLLFIMLVIAVIRCVTLPGGTKGLVFMFKPDFSVFAGTGWFKVFATAGSQMFFSLSLASGAIIAFGSYMKKDDDIEKSSIQIPVLDTLAALLAGMAVLPAIFAEGLEPGGGPGLLFVSLQSVFLKMGKAGAVFGFFFYFLVFVACFSSSIAMMEGGISAIMDSMMKRGKTANPRLRAILLITVTTLIGGSLVAIDQLGGNTAMWKPFGLGSWLDVFDLGAEGILMPVGGFLMAIMLGWTKRGRGFLDDEIGSSSPYRTKGFVNLCWRWIAPVFMAVIIFVQISSFFFSQTAWYQALMG